MARTKGARDKRKRKKRGWMLPAGIAAGSLLAGGAILGAPALAAQLGKKKMRQQMGRGAGTLTKQATENQRLTKQVAAKQQRVAKASAEEGEKLAAMKKEVEELKKLAKQKGVAFSNYENRYANFARTKGAKDKKQRKRRNLINAAIIGTGLAATGGIAAWRRRKRIGAAIQAAKGRYAGMKAKAYTDAMAKKIIAAKKAEAAAKRAAAKKRRVVASAGGQNLSSSRVQLGKKKASAALAEASKPTGKKKPTFAEKMAALAKIQQAAKKEMAARGGGFSTADEYAEFGRRRGSRDRRKRKVGRKVKEYARKHGVPVIVARKRLKRRK